MELDEFKTRTREKPGKLVRQHALPDLESMIKKKSTGIVEKIKRSLILELFFALAFIVFNSYIVFRFESLYIQVFGYLMFVLCIWFIYYLQTIYKKIRRQENVELSIKENLQNLIAIVAGFTRLYFQLTMFFLPLAFFSGLFIGYFNRMSLQPGVLPVISSKEIYTYVSAFAGWSVLIFIFTKCYLQKLYGDHLENLREQLTELDQ